MRAVRYARDIGFKNIEARVVQLARNLRDALSQVDGVSVYDQGQRKCGIVTFRKSGFDPADLEANFGRAGSMCRSRRCPTRAAIWSLEI